MAGLLRTLLPPAARRHGRRWLDATVYALRGLALRAEQAVRPPATRPRADGRRRILIVDDMLPDPRFGAGYPRAAAIVRTLVAMGYAVELYPMHANEADRVRMTAAHDGAVRFHAGGRAHGLRRLLWREGDRFDVLFVSRPSSMAALLAARWRPARRIPVIYDAEAVVAPRDRLRRALFGPPMSDRDYDAALAGELTLARSAAAVATVGPLDAAVIGATLTTPVFALPHSVTARPDAPGPAGRADLLFVGRLTGAADQSPNVDSVRWFVTEVMPRLDCLLGTGYRLNVAGRIDAPELAALASDRVVFHGIVDDLALLYDQARLFVAPTRFAAGIPLKVLEAMGEGVPCVVTELLARQLGAEADVVASGANADAFAAACARLYRDDAAWSAAQAAGFAHIGRIASPTAFDATLAALIDRVFPPTG